MGTTRHLPDYEGSECFSNYFWNPVSVSVLQRSRGSFPSSAVKLQLPAGGGGPGGGSDHLQVWPLAQWEVVVVGSRYLRSGLRADEGILSEDVGGTRPDLHHS